MTIEQIGRMLLVSGLVIAGLGALLLVSGRLPFLGRLPGDITITRENVTIYIPIATSIVLSLLLTLVLSLFFRR
jgi:hypothetical protein